MWRPVESGVVGVICAGYAALACAIDTKRSAVCRLEIDFTFGKRESTLPFTTHRRSIRLTGILCREGSTALA